MMMNNNDPREELKQYLDAVEHQFNPSDPLMLQAVLYLFYSNYTILHNEDEIFTNKLLRLVEQCNCSQANLEQTCCPMPEEPRCCGTNEEGPHPEYHGPVREDPRVGHVTNPYIFRDPVSTCMPVQTRRMFLINGPTGPANGPRRC